MSLLAKLVAYPAAKLLGRRGVERFVPLLAKYAGVNLIVVAYNGLGILKYQDHDVSGERYLLAQVLKKLFYGRSTVTCFDVGANVGEYTQLLVEEFPWAKIYVFEPNQHSYERLVENTGQSVVCINAGLGAWTERARMYTYCDSPASSHASLHGEVFRAYHKRDDITSVDVDMETLDDFCERHEVSKIDFLKIDTEGNELAVLEGAQAMLSGGGIDVIQFEFGECDIAARVFLKDFYECLKDYDLYRLDSQRLIPMIEYSVTNEIFRYQNLVAFRKGLGVQFT